MPLRPTRATKALALFVLTAAQAVSAADADLGALSLQSASPDKPAVAEPTKAFIEAAAGTGRPREGTGWQGLGRLTLDVRHGDALAASVRYALSVRLDATSPKDWRVDNPVLSLREALVGWQDSDAANLLDFGRINLRDGPAYGYNPTDFFRDNALRTITTANPFMLRENRLGTVMFRGQHLWSDGSISLALAPKLASRRSSHGLNPDWGATNSRQRALATVNNRWGDAFSSQLLLYKEQESSARWGVNATTLLSDAVTAHAEWTRSREPDLLTRALALSATDVTRSRAAIGLTYTTATKLSLTTEVHYNGFALDREAVRALPNLDQRAPAAYFGTTLSLQDNAARNALLVYVTQRDLVVKNLELTGFAKFNRDDGSRLLWLELRYRMDRVEWSMQLQHSSGDDASEFSFIPIRSSISLTATTYF